MNRIRTREERHAFRSVLQLLPAAERSRLRRMFAGRTPFRIIAREMASILRDPDGTRDARSWSSALARYGFVEAVRRDDLRVRRLAPSELRPWLVVREAEPWLLDFAKLPAAEQKAGIALTRDELRGSKRAAA